jgi:phosphoglucosamine mutase
LPGDILIGLIAEKLHQEGNLKKDTVIVTQMSNLALVSYLEYMGISTIRTNVGDRYVMEAIRKGNYNFGGEQSGHLVLNDYSTTGDGLIAALQILSIICTQKQPVSKIANIFTLAPQILKNIKYQNSDKNPLESPIVKKAIKDAEIKLGKDGRVFVRKSGTENLIRVMVEGKSKKLITKIADEIAATISE